MKRFSVVLALLQKTSWIRLQQRSRTHLENGIGCGVLEWIERPEMRTRNDYTLGVVWAALIGLVAIAFWLKVPLG